MKTLYECITESAANRDAFIEKVKAAMDKAIADKSIDAWFFNSAEDNKKEKAAAEKYISGFLPGKWKFIEIALILRHESDIMNHNESPTGKNKVLTVGLLD